MLSNLISYLLYLANVWQYSSIYLKIPSVEGTILPDAAITVTVNPIINGIKYGQGFAQAPGLASMGAIVRFVLAIQLQFA